MTRAWLAIILIVLGIAAAKAIPASQQIILFGSSAAPVLTPLPTGSALLVDNTNPALLVDGVNPACLVGGC